MLSASTDLTIDPDRAQRAESPLESYSLTKLFLAALVFRLIYNAFRELVPDEAYYWVWSRHLSASYLDHPPMVAYLIAASSRLFGSTEFGVRLPAALMSSATAVLATWLVQYLTRDRSVTRLAAIILVVSPVITMTSTLITPDTPLMFFVMLGLCVGVRLFDDSQRPLWAQTAWWCALGACSGLAMLSKYTGVLLPTAVFLLVITSVRRELLRPGCYLAAIIAIGLFAPVIWWNWKHDWVSFRFQFNHGLENDDVPGLLGFLGYLGGLLLTWTPVLFVVTVAAMVVSLRQFRSQRNTVRLVLITAVLPLALFAYSSFHKKVEANWPAMAFAPAVVILAIWAQQNFAKRKGLLSLGWKIALVFTVIAHIPELALMAHIRIVPANDVFGWQQLAQWVDDSNDGAPVFCSNYQNAAELSFYLKGQPEVWSVNTDRRSNAYDYFDDKPDLEDLDRVAFVGGQESIVDRYFPTLRSADLKVSRFGQPIRTRTLTLADRTVR